MQPSEHILQNSFLYFYIKVLTRQFLQVVLCQFKFVLRHLFEFVFPIKRSKLQAIYSLTTSIFNLEFLKLSVMPLYKADSVFLSHVLIWNSIVCIELDFLFKVQTLEDLWQMVVEIQTPCVCLNEEQTGERSSQQ